MLIFFALSGATLYISNGNKVNNINEVKSFYLKRFFRIWPAYFSALIVSVITVLIFQNSESIAHPFIQKSLLAFELKDLFLYLSLVFNFAGPQDLFNVSFWTLPVEFQYYLLFPLLVFPFFKMKKYPISLSLLIGLSMTILPKVFDLPFPRLELFTSAISFFGGVAVASFYKNISFRMNRYSFYMVLMMILLWVFLMNESIVTNPFSGIPLLWENHFLYCVLAVLTVLVALITQSNDEGKKSSLFKIGEVSYSLYLIHMPIFLIAAMISIAMELPEIAQWILFIPMAFAIALIVAKASYYFIEVPSIRLGRRFTQVKR